ncbi:myrosinase 1 [Frankliniella occidentalis]|uniref:Myrosinase 1 n=1 Tax=Frankliniella occidentalis TaxID=133901 RepID=A0A6J1T3V7_FRAOC|nr:myrosinase 1 [Frankliniella occidentalis]
MLARLTIFGLLSAWGQANIIKATSGQIQDVPLPDNFLIGAAVSAFQTEGWWNKGGKSESMVDHVLHTGRLGTLGYKNANDSDNAADSYHRFKEDIAIAKQLKLQVYRFSISWSRVLPEGDVAKPNMEGVQYYHDLIGEILKQGLIPFATVYHFDHPQVLEDQFRGWQSREMIRKFRDYARFVFNEFSSKVQLWATINEPNVMCTYFGTLLITAGLVKAEDYDAYKCMHHITLAHAEAYRAFKEDKLTGRVGVNTWIVTSKPNTTSIEDSFAAEVFNQLQAGSILHPIVFGDYPELVKTFTGHLRPEFTPAEKEMMRGATDFISLNIYAEGNVAYKDPDSTPETLPFSGAAVIVDKMTHGVDFISFRFADGQGRRTENYPWYSVAPDAMRSSLLWTWQRYKLPIMVAENGISLKKGMDEKLRTAYYSAYLRSVVSVVNDFKVNVMGYIVWSLIDTFEWSNGYDAKFGIAAVDYESGSFNRSLKSPPDFWLQIAEKRVIPFVEVPQSSSSPSSYRLVTTKTLLLAILLSVKHVVQIL